MAAFDRESPALGAGAVLLVGLGAALLALSCSGGPKPATKPPAPAPEEATEAATVEETPAEAAEQPAEDQQAEEEPSGEAAGAEEDPLETDPTVVYIQRGPEGGPPSLWEASVKAREERAHRPPRDQVAVITDENLAEHAAKGEITVVDAPTEAPSAPATDLSEEDRETYWRRRVLGERQAWHDAQQKVEDLEQQVADLRYRFYAQDDPYYRDTQIKPAWDKALEDLEVAREEVESAGRVVEDTLVEGHQSGALPGWLREGLELEPQPSEGERPSTPDLEEHEVIEPPVAQEGDDGDGR